MPFHVARIVLTALAGLALVDPITAKPCTPKAKVANGTYLGVHNEAYDQDFFLGVPFAQPPVGPLRFKAPESLTEAFGHRSATEYGWMCIGYGSDTSNLGNPISEDCLTLNIVRPSGVKPGEDLPVGVWVHGGVSDSNETLCPSTSLANVYHRAMSKVVHGIPDTT